MKTTRLLFILLLFLIGFTATNEAKAQPGISVSFNTFYNELGPYGRWINHPRYGQVWVYGDPNFRPYYTDGHWEYTDYGWEWISDFDWGWAPFHYGRWEMDPELGWVWIPGYDWAPAWVAWSQYDGYYGWAPLGYGLGLNISINAIPYNYWVYAPREYITSPRIYNYCVPFERARYYNRNAVIINNFYDRGGRRYWMGPDRREVERFTGARLEPRRVENDRFQWHGQPNRGDVFRQNNNERRNQAMNERRDYGFPQAGQRPNNEWHGENRNVPGADQGQNPNQWRRRDYAQPNTQWQQNNPAPQRPSAPPQGNPWRNERSQGGYDNGNSQRQQPVYNNPAPRPQPQMQPQNQPNFGGRGWHERAPEQNNQSGGNNGRGRFSERRG
jgi:hypothetical protein